MQANTQPVELEHVTISMELPIAAAPERVYQSFVSETGCWWPKQYLMGRGSVDIVLDARPGGMLMETDSAGGGTAWAQVISLYPGRSIRLGIPEGVYWSGPGHYSLRFDAAEDGTTLLKLEHQSTQQKSAEGDGHSGYVQGWTTILAERLKPYCETGRVDNPLVQ